MASIRVTCAVVQFGGKILAVQRSSAMSLPLKWEFPGGKVEPDESDEECIHREIFEELNIHIELVKKLTTSEFHYPEISVMLIPFLANYKQGDIILKEHAAYGFFHVNELKNLDWADADIPVLNQIINL